MYQDQEQDGPNTLKETEAQERAKHFSAVSYDLSLNLQPNQKTYRAVLKITFNFKGSDDQNHLFLDFVGKTIESFKVNGKAVSENPFKRNRVFFKKEDLNNGSNVVEINYVNNYDKSGAGFHQFIDPVDNEEYLYTNFEPFDAHRWLPCFEQPDIKGKIKLTVKAPEKWKVLANGKKIDLDTKDGFSTWKFEETPAISTYLFACVVGPYDEFTDNYDNRIPLGLYVRKSLSKHLDKDVFFQQTKQGFGFYEKFFEYQYPFSKYDQVFVPEFNAGAMENVGCVTFTEHYIFRDPPTKSQVANRADTILHEMAHMWFGDLVSPVWWDGLWLNESFATYMAALCVAEATEFGNLSWQNFNSGMKAWAYREDQLSTTHPIQGTVADTDQTFLNFDGITYGKGASLLKQLVYVIGKDSFQKGLSHYFKKHEWGNTTIQDFLLALSYGAKQCGFDYDEKKWSSQWLETAGLNSFLPHIESSEDGTIKSLVIEQEHPPEHPTYRNHTTEIVFVNWDASKNATTVEGTFRVEVLAQKETPVGSLVGKKRPDFVFLNYNDHAFVKCLLDDKSELFARTHLEKLSDPFLRQLLWDAYYNMARDGKMLSKHYLALVTDKIKFETDPKLIQTILRRASGTLSFFIPDAIKLEESQKLFDLSLESLKKSPENSEQAIIWARSAIDFAKTKESVATLVPFLEPGKKLGIIRWISLRDGPLSFILLLGISRGPRNFWNLS
eukprot:TRINITY_DN649_c0_g3_i1.p1 TRINITY_DN649_c0_g3~~TRINITY_DN649_c0_g3_i1.p1  ORF type:complete len:725 (-),score=168.78 TRINITY_DN649_c0_g3_i1:516-2690(-)